MTAAIQAAQNGDKNVVVLEKMSVTGGNTTRSTGGLNAAATALQAERGIEDSVELMIEDTMKGGKEVNNPDLVRVLAENSASAVEWVNSIGGDLTDVGRMAGRLCGPLPPPRRRRCRGSHAGDHPQQRSQGERTPRPPRDHREGNPGG